MLKKLAISAAAITGAIFGLVGVVNASSAPAFNIYDASQANYGNEADWLTVGDSVANATGNSFELCEDDVAFVRAYIHNGSPAANNGTNFDGPGVAHNTFMQLNTNAATPSTSHTITGVIGADGTQTTDQITVTCADGPVTLTLERATQYTSTAQWANQTTNGFNAPFAVSHDGTQSGVYPGCWEFISYMYLKVTATAEEEPEPVDPSVSVSLKKYVNGEDAQDANSAVVLETGDTASWRIDVTNTVTDATDGFTVDGIVVEDAVPAGIGAETNISATIGSYDAASNVWTIPSMTANSTASLSFDTVVTAESGTVENVATITNTGGEDNDGSDNNSDPAFIAIDNPELPVNQCTSLVMITSEKVDDKVNATLKVKTNNDDEIVKIVYTITDEDGESRTITVDGETTVTAMFEDAGTYTINAVVTFDNGGEDATCNTTLVVKTDTVTVVEKETKTVVKEVLGVKTVKELPATGAGSLAGLFGLSALGASVKGYFTSRKNLTDTLLNR